MLKWRGPDGLTSRHTVQADEALAQLEPVEQVRRLQELAFKLKPNRAWRLVAYDFQGYPRVELED
jgi:hypothetical protein